MIDSLGIRRSRVEKKDDRYWESNKQFKESLVCHVHKITKKRKEKQAKQKKQQ